MHSPLLSQTGMPREAVIQRMLDTFSGMHVLCAADIGESTLQRAHEQCREKFGTEHWLNLVP